MPRFRGCCFSSLHVSRHNTLVKWVARGLSLNLPKLRHSLVLFSRIGAWHLLFKRSRTSPSAVLCNSFLYFIKCKISRAGEFGLPSLYFVNSSVKHIWRVFKKNGLVWPSDLYLKSTWASEFCAWGSSTLFLERVGRNSSPCCVPWVPCCVRAGEGAGQGRVQALVWDEQQQQRGQSLSQGWAVSAVTHLLHTMCITALLSCCLTGGTAQRKTGFYNTQLCPFDVAVGKEGDTCGSGFA